MLLLLHNDDDRNCDRRRFREGLRHFVTMPAQPADAPRGLGGDEHVAAQCDGRGGAALHGRLHLVPAHGVQPLPAFLRRCAFALSGPREMEPLLVLSVLVQTTKSYSVPTRPCGQGLLTAHLCVFGWAVTSLLQDHASNSLWGRTATAILAQHKGSMQPPRTGKDAGAHPPITPMRSCSRAQLRGGNSDWRLYEYIARHFIASLMGPCVLPNHKAFLCSCQVKQAHNSWHRTFEISTSRWCAGCGTWST